ncbi:hypothetical protein E4U53_005752 [Claviceps sorghi]|nr:hypothetical protein E4U53_005752 [Claviceps sorghi]
MVPVADLHGIALAATLLLSSALATEHPNCTPTEQCDEEQDKKSSTLRRRNRKQSIRSNRNRRSRDVEESENGESEDETEEPAAISKPNQTPLPNQRNQASELPSSTSSASPTQPVSKPMGQMQQPSLPPAPAPLIPANPSSVRTPSRVPSKPARAADIVNPVQLPPENFPPSSSRTADPAHSTLLASTTWSISLSSTTGWPLPTPVAIIPMPISSLSAVGSPADPVATPNNLGFSVTAPSPNNLLPTMRDGGLPGDDHHEQNNLPHTNAEKALIAVGSIGNWLVWWLSRRRRNTANTREHPPPPFPEDTPPANRRIFVRKTLSRIPILNKHIDGDTDSGWTNLDHSYVGPANKTAASSTGGAQRHPSQAPAIVVRTEIVRKSFRAGRENSGAHPQVAEQQSVSCTEGQHSHAPGLGTQPCKPCPSDNSSLSSGFGDGQFMMNNNNQNDSDNALDGAYRSETPAAVVTTINAPSFSAVQRDSASIRSERGFRRDTVCTEASEDLPPGFRTVHSWVRQQSSRVARAKQRARSPPASEDITSSASKMPP